MDPNKLGLIFALTLVLGAHASLADRHVRVSSGFSGRSAARANHGPSPAISSDHNQKDLTSWLGNSEDELKNSVTTNADIISSSNATQSQSSPQPSNMFTTREPDYCIATPQNLSFCGSRLGWGPNMGVPNLLDHKSELELTNLASDIRLDELLSVKCKASNQMKLLLCSILSPVCLDIIVPPCRRLCMAVRYSCEPAIKRMGLEWPKFLDCRRFPRGQGSCINRQPNVLEPQFNGLIPSDKHSRHEANLNSSNSSILNRITPKRKRKEKKSRIKNHPADAFSTTTTTTTTPTTITTTASTITTAAATSTTIAPIALPTSDLPITYRIPVDGQIGINTDNQDESQDETIQNSGSHGLAQSTVVPSNAPTRTTETPEEDATTLGGTSSLPVDPAPSIPGLGSKESSGTTQNPNSAQRDYSSMPVNVTDDLTQLICSSSPTWLIKAKLTDGQLMSAVTKRRLMVRSYRQIFGLPIKTIETTNTSGTNVIASGFRRRQGSSINSSTSLYLSLANSTVFVTAMGPHIYTQPLSDALPKTSESELRTTRYYMMAGNLGPAGARQASVFVVWPNGRTNSADPDNQGNLNIVATYRDFKRKGIRLCDETHTGTPTFLAGTRSRGQVQSGDQLLQESDKVATGLVQVRPGKRRRLQTTTAPQL